MSPRVCPFCYEQQNCDQAAFEHHVNSHLSDERAPASQSSRGSKTDRTSPFDDVKALPSSENASCPICSYPFAGLSEAQRGVHVNSCMDAQTAQTEASIPQIQRRRTRSGQTINPSPSPPTRLDVYTDDDLIDVGDDDDCVVPPRLADTGRNGSGGSGGRGAARFAWSGPAKPTASADRSAVKVEKGDEWYDTLQGAQRLGDVPSFVTPALYDVLQASANQYTTRRAVVCRDTTYMRGVWGYDLGWSCGYRNAEMLISSLVQFNPAYRHAFSSEVNGGDPGMRRIQVWMTEAWDAGFDLEGQKHFKEKEKRGIVGSRAWIGTADVAAIFFSKGIECKLYDFPKCRSGAGQTRPNPNKLLVDWMVQYFDEGVSDRTWNKRETPAHTKPANAFDAIMQSKEDSVRRSERYPVMLQHDGHSRTVVGYEVDGKGNTHLLVLDPGNLPYLEKSRYLNIRVGIATSIRSTAFRHSLTDGTARLAALASPSIRPAPSPPVPAHKISLGLLSIPTRSRRSSGTANTHEQAAFSRPYTNGASDQVDPSETLFSPVAPARTAGSSSNNPFTDDEAEGGKSEGWVKKRLNKIKSNSAELAPGKVMKKIRSDSTGSNGHNGYEALDGHEEVEGLITGQSADASLAAVSSSAVAHGKDKAKGKKLEKKQPWPKANGLLKDFRANLNPVIGAPSEYQVLAIPAEVFLEEAQRARFKVLDSKVIA